MAQSRITIEGPARGALALALLGLLSEQVDLLAGTLSARTRDSNPAPVAEAYHSLRATAELLELLQWRTDPHGQLTLERERQLPLALAALRNELSCAEEIVADSREHGATAQAATLAHLDATRRALDHLQAAARDR